MFKWWLIFLVGASFCTSPFLVVEAKGKGKKPFTKDEVTYILSEYSVDEYFREYDEPDLIVFTNKYATKNTEINLANQNVLDLSNKGLTSIKGLEKYAYRDPYDQKKDKGINDVHILDLSNNYISSIPEGILPEFKGLTTLILSHNMLKLFPWNEISKMPALQQVVLTDNQLTEISPFHSGNLRSIELDLNQFTQLPSCFYLSEEDYDYKSLTIDLSKNQIKKKKWHNTTSTANGHLTCAFKKRNRSSSVSNTINYEPQQIVESEVENDRCCIIQ